MSATSSEYPVLTGDDQWDEVLWQVTTERRAFGGPNPEEPPQFCKSTNHSEAMRVIPKRALSFSSSSSTYFGSSCAQRSINSRAASFLSEGRSLQTARTIADCILISARWISIPTCTFFKAACKFVTSSISRCVSGNSSLSGKSSTPVVRVASATVAEPGADAESASGEGLS